MQFQHGNGATDSSSKSTWQHGHGTTVDRVAGSLAVANFQYAGLMPRHHGCLRGNESLCLDLSCTVLQCEHKRWPCALGAGNFEAHTKHWPGTCRSCNLLRKGLSSIFSRADENATRAPESSRARNPANADSSHRQSAQLSSA
jgi:hypothetical protein